MPAVMQPDLQLFQVRLVVALPASLKVSLIARARSEESATGLAWGSRGLSLGAPGLSLAVGEAEQELGPEDQVLGSGAGFGYPLEETMASLVVLPLLDAEGS
eukprot:3224238-Rhodomonas_salina.1